MFIGAKTLLKLVFIAERRLLSKTQEFVFFYNLNRNKSLCYVAMKMTYESAKSV